MAEELRSRFTDNQDSHSSNEHMHSLFIRGLSGSTELRCISELAVNRPLQKETNIYYTTELTYLAREFSSLKRKFRNRVDGLAELMLD